MKVFILAGGGGTRLYPLSTEEKPKQFLKLVNDKSLLVNTIERFLPLCPPADITVITNEKYSGLTETELNENGLADVNILTEPCRKNTAPAILLAALHAKEKGCDDSEVLVFSPSDHAVSPQSEFENAVNRGAKVAEQGYITVFGIVPDKPETGYGYIKPGEPLGTNGNKVERFTEKPDALTAETFIKDGYLWNGGIYCFTVRTLLDQLKKLQPELNAAAQKGFSEFRNAFCELPSVSIDYAITEKTDKAAVIPMNLNWSDIGSWNSLNAFVKNSGRTTME